MVLLISAILVAAAIAWGCGLVASELKSARSEASRVRTLDVLRLFAPALEAAAGDPRALLVWEPLARIARQLFPDEFASLERASGVAFPFGAERFQAAHAQWTAEWLAWERAHDAEYKLKAAAIEEELARSEGSAVARAKADVVEREKLEIYQRRYQDYVRVAKALQGLAS